MAGFGFLKKLTGKTLGNNRKKMQNEDDEYMGLGLIDAAIELRHDVTGTTGMVGKRWKKGDSMIGKFLNKQPEDWPPEETENGLQYGQRGARDQRRQQDLAAIRERRLNNELQGIPVKPTTPEVEGQIGFLGDIDIGI